MEMLTLIFKTAERRLFLQTNEIKRDFKKKNGVRATVHSTEIIIPRDSDPELFYYACYEFGVTVDGVQLWVDNRIAI